MSTTSPDLDPFEQLVRERLHRLADHAPATVRLSTDVRLEQATGAPRRLGRRRAAGIGAAIVAIAGGAGITAVSFQAADDGGGAASPEEAVRQFVDALAAEDVLGMVDTTAPEEVAALRAMLDDAAGQAERLHLLDESFTLDAVAGVQVDVAGLGLSTTYHDDALAIVSATSGTATASFDPSLFPFGEQLLPVVPTGAGTPTTASTALDPDGPFRLATVRRGEDWYVSVGFTVAELARVRAGADVPPRPDLGQQGEGSPEDAARAFYDAAAALDLSALVSRLAPGESDAIVRYSPLWLPQATTALDEARREGLSIEITEMSVETEGDGERRVVTPTEFAIDVTLPAPWVQAVEPPTRVVVFADGRAAVVPPEQPLPLSPDEADQLYPSFDAVPADVLEGAYERLDEDLGVGAGFSVTVVDGGSEEAGAAVHGTLRRADGCTTATGSVAELYRTWYLATGGWEPLDDGSVRTCSTGSNLMGGFVTSLLLLGGEVPAELAPIVVTEVEGQWYVSPIGTVTSSVFESFHETPDGASLFDTPVAPFLFGGLTREAFDTVIGQPIEALPEECRSIASIGADGLVTGVVDEPDPATARQCSWIGLGGGWTEYPADVSADVVETTAVPNDD